jgi:formate hydrogenlyase subunit 6/NADH:ubiquinone oxidoreductase subunit I
VETSTGEDKKRVVDEFSVDFGLCMFCGLCVEQCPRAALVWVGDYEFCTVRREDLVWKKAALLIPWKDHHAGEVRMKGSWTL